MESVQGQKIELHGPATYTPFMADWSNTSWKRVAYDAMFAMFSPVITPLMIIMSRILNKRLHLPKIAI